MKRDRRREWTIANARHKASRELHAFADAIRNVLDLDALYTGSGKRKLRGRAPSTCP